MAKEPKIAAATGTASGGGNDSMQATNQAAMDAAAQECFDKGIHDPEKVRAAKLKARDEAKGRS